MKGGGGGWRGGSTTVQWLGRRHWHQIPSNVMLIMLDWYWLHSAEYLQSPSTCVKTTVVQWQAWKGEAEQMWTLDSVSSLSLMFLPILGCCWFVLSWLNKRRAPRGGGGSAALRIGKMLLSQRHRVKLWFGPALLQLCVVICFHMLF